MVLLGLLGFVKMISVTTLAFAFLVMALLLDGGLVLIFGGSVLVSGVVMTFLLSEPVTGGCFLVFSLALLLSQTKMWHRFSLAQMLFFFVLIISGMSILEFMYRFFLAVKPTTGLVFVPFGTAIIFGLAGVAGLFKWPNRGFMAIFCADTLSTKYALRLLAVKTGLIFTSSFLMLAGTEGMIIFVILLGVISAFLAWLNIKLLYKFDLEHFLMKEALRVNNISIQMSMEDLEKEKGKYINKLNYQDKYRDVVESLS